MPVVSELPKELVEREFQRNSPDKFLGVRTPPLQFIPSRPPNACTQEDKVSVKLSFPNKVLKTYQVFFSGNLE